ncbi:hypothetical protein [Gimesia fumaroli]|uniref:Uncharacterized protein n=1 Tax=Gimesia fumaroli TaxID=2527976 RepID=A0A518ILP2_9PLAN|nr:hypothetical protein [Gimesia fumaroli]QDV54020.1 hypothetical protein Enr17x_61030 [Gimesia fumaroli]
MDIKITDDEALVLYELLTRFTEEGLFGFEDQAEMRAVWNLQAILEAALSEPLLSSYKTLLAEARDRLRDEGNLTNADAEQEKGRLALWLEPEQIQFLIQEWHKNSKEEPEIVQKQWGEVAFRAMSALHKAGIKHSPEVPQSEADLLE